MTILYYWTRSCIWLKNLNFFLLKIKFIFWRLVVYIFMYLFYLFLRIKTKFFGDLWCFIARIIVFRRKWSFLLRNSHFNTLFQNDWIQIFWMLISCHLRLMFFLLHKTMHIITMLFALAISDSHHTSTMNFWGKFQSLFILFFIIRKNWTFFTRHFFVNFRFLLQSLIICHKIIDLS